MNFKKIMSMAITGVLAVGLLAGCGKATDSQAGAGQGKDGLPDLKGKN